MGPAKGVKEILYNKIAIMTAHPKLIDKLSTRLTPGARALLDAARGAADGGGVRLFLAGGSARDLLLGRDAIDLDLAVEGDAIALARAVAASTGGRVTKTTEFGTAHVKTPGAAADFAMTRAETYPKPGALPKVRPASLAADLARRDFTINAIALELAGPTPGALYDPHGGVADLGDGLVRVIPKNDRSFQDDATRIVRAARLEARFGFRIEAHTLDLLARDVAYLDSISGTRVRQEIDRTFREADPTPAFTRMEALRVLTVIHPALAVPACGIPAGVSSAAGWALLATGIDAEHVPGLIRRCALTGKQSAAVRAMPQLGALSTGLAQDLRPSELDELLAPFPEDALAAFALAEPAVAPAVHRYLASRGQTTDLRGDDLQALGIPRGPEVAALLRILRSARLDGVVHTRQDEEEMVRHYIATKRAAIA